MQRPLCDRKGQKELFTLILFPQYNLQSSSKKNWKESNLDGKIYIKSLWGL